MIRSLLNPHYREWLWIAGENGKPGVIGDLTNASEAIRAIADPLVQITGVSAGGGDGLTADVSVNAEGGLNVATGATDDDFTMLIPHELAWASMMHPDTMTWDADREAEFECAIQTPSVITGLNMSVGFNTDASPVVMGVTANFIAQFMFDSDDSDTNWMFFTDTNAGADADVDTGVAIVADTVYTFEIKCDHFGTIHGYINGEHVASRAGGAAADTWIPHVGIKTRAASGIKTCRAYGWRLARKYGASD